MTRTVRAINRPRPISSRLIPIIEDVTNMEMKKEQIAEKAKEVIHKNLATVQQIACTLGEHMAETEVLLRSIAKDFAADDEQSSDLTIRTNSNKRDY